MTITTDQAARGGGTSTKPPYPGSSTSSTATNPAGVTTGNHYTSTGGDSPAWTNPVGSSAWTRYVTSPGGGLSITVNTDTTGTKTATLNLADPHGDITATIPNKTNVTAAELTRYTTYTPTGQPQNPANQPHPYGWVGTAQRNNNNPGGLITMGARTYNPTTGRFLQLDPTPGGNPNRPHKPKRPHRTIQHRKLERHQHHQLSHPLRFNSRQHHPLDNQNHPPRHHHHQPRLERNQNQS